MIDRAARTIHEKAIACGVAPTAAVHEVLRRHAAAKMAATPTFQIREALFGVAAARAEGAGGARTIVERIAGGAR